VLELAFGHGRGLRRCQALPSAAALVRRRVVAYWVFAAGVLVRFIASAWRLARSWEPNRLCPTALAATNPDSRTLPLSVSGRSRVRVRVVPGRHVALTAENLI